MTDKKPIGLAGRMADMFGKKKIEEQLTEDERQEYYDKQKASRAEELAEATSQENVATALMADKDVPARVDQEKDSGDTGADQMMDDSDHLEVSTVAGPKKDSGYRSVDQMINDFDSDYVESLIAGVPKKDSGPRSVDDMIVNFIYSESVSSIDKTQIVQRIEYECGGAETMLKFETEEEQVIEDVKTVLKKIGLSNLKIEMTPAGISDRVNFHVRGEIEINNKSYFFSYGTEAVRHGRGTITLFKKDGTKDFKMAEPQTIDFAENRGIGELLDLDSEQGRDLLEKLALDADKQPETEANEIYGSYQEWEREQSEIKEKNVEKLDSINKLFAKYGFSDFEVIADIQRRKKQAGGIITFQLSAKKLENSKGGINSYLKLTQTYKADYLTVSVAVPDGEFFDYKTKCLALPPTEAGVPPVISEEALKTLLDEVSME
ncbi:hypothetical protein A2223_02875 [Candidatus Falkowbacteria bacterium RIFOXYA2_FULL_35_8]|uniref:Uncharacterized protein n=1 Tax=Candidatus Falkowbacteria bacterium RIFOXYC2_FULL_36_12 TaxID=1798002 RepID=A0A1F5SWA7_9BACT|nr:MAG: hypothetical protein A2478_01075 [Candidatus Falkowbacteria bacterium RIFOXYC2_FULL_36_12]OGF31186.1 MAG: hypothetical protein A2300_02965 [Candidatus Falkowbacteria bacterium RIFOXYB2_FULL_35_7]OGF34445.1 MAG: hypothetical protein A2223_02875 [Candidatus Falkowbacteria bacterium RIFOXYA2_FULL_35_8]